MTRIQRTACVLILWFIAGELPAISADDIRLIPYPQNITKLSGSLQLGPAQYVIPKPSGTTEVASGSLSSYLPQSGSSVTVRLGLRGRGLRQQLAHGGGEQFPHQLVDLQ